MNLAKLFETQKILRDRIKYEGEDRFEKLILALLVELGECANEWRGFKFWSKNQEPSCSICRLNKKYPTNVPHKCDNPLLEEYVDGLHFVMEIGIELNYMPRRVPGLFPRTKVNQFIELYYKISELKFLVEQFGKTDKFVLDSYQDIFDHYLHLGWSFGFWEEIEQAYYAKNKINHKRQEQGY